MSCAYSRDCLKGSTQAEEWPELDFKQAVVYFFLDKYASPLIRDVNPKQKCRILTKAEMSYFKESWTLLFFVLGQG